MKIYEDAKDKNVSKTVVFVTFDDEHHKAHIYYDKECTNEVPNEDIPDLFIKGMLMANYYEGKIIQYSMPVEIYYEENTNKWEISLPELVPDPIIN